MEGVITFCGSQVEKVLNYNTAHLMGANIGDIVVPDCRRTIQRMLQYRVSTTERHSCASGKALLGGCTHVNEFGNGYAVEESRRSHPNSSSEALIISDQSSEKSAPILDCNANTLQPSASDFSAASAECCSKNSKNGSSKNKSMGNSTVAGMSSSTRQNIGFGTETSSQSCPQTSDCDDSGEPPAKIDIFCKESAESKFSCEASDRIANIVDDAIGARITANNAIEVKVSSMMHYPKIDSEDGTKISEKAQTAGLHCHRKNSMKRPFASPGASDGRFSSCIAESCRNLTKKRGGTYSSDYSGHGESKETPEEYNESPEGISSPCASSIGESGKKLGECLFTSDIICIGMVLLCNNIGTKLLITEKLQRLTPVYKARFIRGDLSTVWCDLTSSILCMRTFVDDESSFNPKAALAAITNPRGIKSSENYGSINELEEDELLICIRPTFEGEKVGEEFRLLRGVSDGIDGEGKSILDDKSRAGQTKTVVNYSSVKVSSDLTASQKGYPAEEQLIESDNGPRNKRQPYVSKKHTVPSNLDSTARQDVHSVAESLMLMSHHTSK
jgi:hypothetical protein